LYVSKAANNVSCCDILSPINNELFIPTAKSVYPYKNHRKSTPKSGITLIF
jgi:hypothetical protein